MGGCRCTYRNCTMRSDGATHMFHYPVFDKVRCHQWLTNAQRLDFLNLKVSQLKNRVVCQYHFKDECFMNFLKDKLKFEAVPTEDGPFCDSSQLPKNNTISEIARVTKDDIEHEYLSTIDKKANFSVKYGDFLTNCEVMDMDMKNLNLNLELNEIKDESVKKIDYNNIISKYEANYEKFLAARDKIMPEDNPEPSITMLSSKPIVGTKFYELKLSNENQNQTTNKIGQLNTKPKSKKIKIISEKKLSKPIPLPRTATAVPPSIIIQPHIKRNICEFDNNNTDQVQYVINESNEVVPNNVCKENMISEENHMNMNKTQVEKSNIIIQENHMNTNNKYFEKENIMIKENHMEPNNINVTVPLGINYTSVTSDLKIPEGSQALVSNNQTLNRQKPNAMQSKKMKVNEPSPNVSPLKPKITPERVFAIEKKRKFNMKLKEIVESCLEKMDESVKDIDYEAKNNHLKNNQDKKQNAETSCKQQYNVHSLEERLKNMEETLLNKINQNSEKINELKYSLPSTSRNRKSCGIQTVQNEETHKRQLYQEISKYLSAEVNSLIYEELFINKFVEKLPACPPSKKRKKRSFVNII